MVVTFPMHTTWMLEEKSMEMRRKETIKLDRLKGVETSHEEVCVCLSKQNGSSEFACKPNKSSHRVKLKLDEVFTEGSERRRNTILI